MGRQTDRCDIYERERDRTTDGQNDRQRRDVGDRERRDRQTRQAETWREREGGIERVCVYYSLASSPFSGVGGLGVVTITRS